jgi:serine/threonine protein kinase
LQEGPVTWSIPAPRFPEETRVTRTGMSAELPSELVFGKYRLVGVMNSGGMAELYLALQGGLEGFTKIVALKRILPHLAESPDFVEMFVDEGRLATRLDHPNIVRLYEFGASEGQYFMAMEYLPGEDLGRIHHILRQTNKKAPVEIAAGIVQAAAEGLHFAHELTDPGGQPLQLVHRDANPANIIVTYHGAVKVADFGVAKAISNVSHTLAGQIKGKSAYLAPEQALGQDIDRRADVFCLGIVLWESLTGKKLFARENDMASAQAVVSSVVPPPSRLRADVPPELDAVTMKALARNTSQRFQTAGELGDAIDAYFRGRTTRPSSKTLAAWMESLFGKARADAKRSIAQGRNLTTSISVVRKTSEISTESSIAELAAAAGITVVGHGGPSGALPLEPLSSSGTASVARRAGVVVAVLVGAFGLMVAGHYLSRALAGPMLKPSEAGRTLGPATLTLESEPEGAFIFIGGEPTGQYTPATLHGLSGTEPVNVRLEKEGYEPASDSVALVPGQVVQRRLTLEPLYGQVWLQRLPAGAGVVVDGKANSVTGNALKLSVGKHTVQIKVAGQVVSTRTIEVKPGDQTLPID